MISVCEQLLFESEFAAYDTDDLYVLSDVLEAVILAKTQEKLVVEAGEIGMEKDWFGLVAQARQHVQDDRDDVLEAQGKLEE